MSDYQTQVRMTYWCMTCADEQVMDRAKMIEHLRRVHNIEPAKSKPSDQIVMAFDFTGGYSNTHEYVLEGIVFRKNITSERKKTKRSL